MATNLRSGFRLGDFEIRPLSCLIADGHGSVHVHPRAMEVLLFLASRAGELVERKDIFHHVWGKRTPTEEVLTHCVSELRRALQERKEDPHYIQTVPKRGYRLVAPVVVSGDQAASPSPRRDTPRSATAEPSFWDEIKRRRVIRVAVAYAAVAWAIIEAATTIFPMVDLPQWSATVVVLLLAAGFPVAVALAWLLQRTREGIVLDLGNRAAAADSGLSAAVGGRIADIAAVVAVSIAVGFLLARIAPSGLQREPPSLLPPISASSIAVLPFMNMSDDKQTEYFGDGLAEELTRLLAEVTELDVAPRIAAFQFKGKSLGVDSIAERLRVRHILEGSVRPGKEDLRITVQLIDAATSYHTWARQYDRNIEDVLAVQEEIAREVARQIVPVLSPTSEERLSARPTQNVASYDLYLQGRDYLRRPKSEANLNGAAKVLGQALELDPGFARAQAGLCEVQLARYELSSTLSYYDDARTACRQALELGPDSVEVRVLTARLYRYAGHYEEALRELEYALIKTPRSAEAFGELGETRARQGDLPKAEKAFRKAIEIEPGYWRHYSALGNFLYENEHYAAAVEYYHMVVTFTPDNFEGYNNLGAAYYMLDAFEQASQAWEQSLERQPTRTAYTNLGIMYYYMGRFTEAVEAQTNAVELAPDDHRVWGRLAESYRFVEGQADAATRAYQQASELAEQRLDFNPSDWNTCSLLALYYAHLGRQKDAMETLDRARQLAPTEPNISYLSALISIRSGDEETAYRELARAIEQGFSRRLIAADPDLARFRDQPRFVALVGRSDR